MSTGHWHENHWHEWHWDGNHWVRQLAPLPPEVHQFSMAVYPVVEMDLEMAETVEVSLDVKIQDDITLSYHPSDSVELDVQSDDVAAILEIYPEIAVALER